MWPVLQGGDRCTRKFNGNSTYQCELQHGGPTAHEQLSSTVGLRSTVSCYDGARRYCCCNHAPPQQEQTSNQAEMYLHASTPSVGSQTALVSGSIWVLQAVPVDNVSALGDVAISMQRTCTMSALMTNTLTITKLVAYQTNINPTRKQYSDRVFKV